jgi:hypothetical protein
MSLVIIIANYDRLNNSMVKEGDTLVEKRVNMEKPFSISLTSSVISVEG